MELLRFLERMDGMREYYEISLTIKEAYLGTVIELLNREGIAPDYALEKEGAVFLLFNHLPWPNVTREPHAVERFLLTLSREDYLFVKTKRKSPVPDHEPVACMGAFDSPFHEHLKIELAVDESDASHLDMSAFRHY